MNGRYQFFQLPVFTNLPDASNTLIVAIVLPGDVELIKLKLLVGLGVK
jgi:hypothetical protein